MNAPKNPKRNHHHVWQAYLNPWVVGTKIWYKENGVIDQKHPRRLAFERDFYKLTQLNQADLDVLDWVITQGSPGLQKLNRQLLDLLMKGFENYALVKSPTPELQKFMSKHEYEVLENYHEKIENSFFPLLRQALNGNLDFYSSDKIVVFLRYICTQYMRTKGLKERWLKGASREFENADFSKVWNVLIHIFANNIGESLYKERSRRKIQILRNATATPFITSDQPVINLMGRYDGTAPEDLAFYYPLAPDKALYLGDVDAPPLDENITEYLAKYLNDRMRSAAYLQIFSKSRELLEDLPK